MKFALTTQVTASMKLLVEQTELQFLRRAVDADKRSRANTTSMPSHDDREQIKRNDNTILLIDDYLALSGFVCQQLKAAGYLTMVAPSLREAGNLLRNWRPDVVLSELELHDGCGISFIREMRSSGKLDGCAVIAYTGSIESSAHAAALSAGFNSILVKPVDPELLVACIERWLQLVNTASGDRDPA